MREPTWGGTYSKPSDGIPKSDLASAVQTSLEKADSALQSETDPTVPAWAKASTKPSYTASEVGLGNVGNFKAVSTVASQGLSDTEKANARINIGAGTGDGTYSKPSGGIPKTDLASAVQTSLGLADKSLQHTTVSGSPDLDTYLTTGVYHIATQTATHAPTTNHATLFVDATVGTPYQIFKPDSSDTVWYSRHRSGSTWTAWVAMTFTDTTYSAATTSAAGLMSATDKTKLNGIATGANNYTHPTSAGWKHIPSGGSDGKILVYSGSSGTAKWSDIPGQIIDTTDFFAISSDFNLISANMFEQGNHIFGDLILYATGPQAFTAGTINTSYKPYAKLYSVIGMAGIETYNSWNAGFYSIDNSNGVINFFTSVGQQCRAIIHIDYLRG